ncbi:MAG: glycosyltransferase family A protein [Maricaulaceae bacterium]
MIAPTITPTHSAHRIKSRPTLSILIPFFRDNPSELIETLASIAGQSVEVLTYDDGTGDKDLSREVSAAVKSAACQASLFTAHDNRGRAFGRNYLFDMAKADWVLFLDADMMPMNEHFITTYLTEIKAGTSDVIFGGFNVLETNGTPETEIHRVMSITSDCAPAAERQRLGPKNVASSNLCVRKTVLTAEPFDTGFSGWGWEDSEWAARVSTRFRLKHIDNPALHLGLESTDTMLNRFRTSGHNYMRFTQRHPELASSLPLNRWVTRLRKTPGHQLLRPVLKLMVKINQAPIKLRIVALKLWRASWYAEVSHDPS